MSASDDLRDAAAQMRREWYGTTQEDFYNAVADWLAFAGQYRSTAHIKPAVAVARAYLGADE